MEGCAGARLGWEPVAACGDVDGMGHMLVEVVHVFKGESRRVGGDA